MPNLIYYNYEYGYWSRYHKVTFDGPNRLILVNAGVTNLNVLTDIYSDWKEWIQSDDASQYTSRFLAALAVTGGDPLPGEEALDATFFLINGWRIKPYPGSYQLTIDGNLFTVDGSPINVSADGSQNNVTLVVNNSTIVRRIGTLTDSVESTKIDEVWKIHGLDTNNPLTVSPTERTAGADIQQTISENDPVPDSTTVRRQ